MTVKEFRNMAGGIDEYQIWGKTNLLAIFYRVDGAVVPEEVADKKVIDLEFDTNYDKILCVITVES